VIVDEGRSSLARLRGTARGGGLSGLVGPIDEVFYPARHEAELLRDQESIIPAPAPLAGDGDKGITDDGASRFAGRIRLDVPPPIE